MAPTDNRTTRQVAELNGLDYLKRYSHSVDQPNLLRLLGVHDAEIEHSRVTLTLATRPDHANPLGTVHGGVFATMLDSVMGSAVHTTLEAGYGYSTLEFKINFTRAMRTDGSTLKAVGTVVHRGRTIATAEGKILDDHGRLISHATTTCIILPSDPTTIEGPAR